MSLVYHQCCKACRNILTGEEMDLHLKDLMGLCLGCRAKEHADSFKSRMEEAQKEEVIND